jgi:hypothetical protein
MSPAQRIAALRLRGAMQSEPTNSPIRPTASNWPTQPTAAMETGSSTPSSSTTVIDGAARNVNNGLTTATKVGLAMIPIVLVTVALWIVLLFWYRRRRSARTVIRQSVTSSVPGKDDPSYSPSLDSTRRTSKVYQMTAFSTPVHDDRNPDPQTFGDRQVDERVDTGARTKTNVNSVPLRSPHMIEGDLDSPIDARSPFRLKRGDTVKRNSLGTALIQLWPLEPPTALTRPSTNDELPAPVVRQQRSVYHLYPGRGSR